MMHALAAARFNAVLVKVSSMGLQAKHLGKSCAALLPYLLSIEDRFGVNVAGEGGEYETITLDCPLFSKTVHLVDAEPVTVTEDSFAPTCYLRVPSVRLEVKDLSTTDATLRARLGCVPPAMPVPGPQDPAVEAAIARDVPVRPAHTTDSASCITYTSQILGRAEHSLAQQAMEVLQQLLEAAGQSPTTIVFVELLVSDMADFSAVNAVFEQQFQGCRPARACVQVALPGGAAVAARAVVCQVRELTRVHAAAWPRSAAHALTSSAPSLCFAG